MATRPWQKPRLQPSIAFLELLSLSCSFLEHLNPRWFRGIPKRLNGLLGRPGYSSSGSMSRSTSSVQRTLVFNSSIVLFARKGQNSKPKKRCDFVVSTKQPWLPRVHQASICAFSPAIWDSRFEATLLGLLGVRTLASPLRVLMSMRVSMDMGNNQPS